MKRQDLKKYDIPDTPGVYFWKDDKEVLYVGKATSLRDRIRSYFAPDIIQTRGPLILDMVTRSTSIAWEETNSVLEALVREAALINEYQPYCNTREKDDRTSLFVGITKDPHPIVLLLRGKDIDFSNLTTKTYKLKTIFGPFLQGHMIREGLKIIRKIFPFDDEMSIKKQNRAFYQQIGLAPRSFPLLDEEGVGGGAHGTSSKNSTTPQSPPHKGGEEASEFQESEIQIGEAEINYQESLRKLTLFLGGRSRELRTRLEEEMKVFAEKEDFEQAARVRNQLFALDHIRDISMLKRQSEKGDVRIEAFDIAHLGGDEMVGGMVVVENGAPKKSDYRKFIIRSVAASNDPAALLELLSRRFSHPEWEFPGLVVVDGNQIQRSVAEKVLTELGRPIPIVAVTKDHRHKPKAIVGNASLVRLYRDQILLANAEAHRYTLSFHKKRRDKKFLGEK